MKKLLILFSLLICFASFGQSPVKVIRVANKTSLFVDNLPKSTIIIDTQTKSRYLTLQPVLGTKSIATCTGLELRLDVINADLIEVLTATDTTESVSPRNMIDYLKLNGVPYVGANQDVDLGTYNLSADSVNGTSILINGLPILNNVRFLQDHDSLSTLQERSYNSLTDKPSLTQLHDPVTLAGTYDYITLSGQQITRNQIDYSTDIANIPATFSATSHGNEKHNEMYITQSAAVVPNSAITGGTATKITYDSKGLVIQGDAATTADINDALNRRYVTDSQLANIHASGSDNQTISTTGAAGNITLSGSGGTLNLNVNDADNDPTNEIQDLSLSGNTLSLTGDATTVNIASATAVAANTAKVTNATHTGDVTGATVLTLATVNSNIGTFNNVTINAKGLATAGSNVAYEPAFTKNTAFNKNFGTTTGTVLQGRTFGTAANNNTGDFVAYRTFGSAANSSVSDFEVPLTFGTGLSRVGNTVTATGGSSYTDADARAAISLTTTGSAGASTYTPATGVLNVPVYTFNLGTLANDNTATTGDYIPWIDVGTSTDKKMTIAKLSELTSQWTTGLNGINYNLNVGIGAVAHANYKLYSAANVADYGTKISNTNISGKGLAIQAGSAVSNAFSITPYAGGSESYLNIKGNGIVQMFQNAPGTASVGHGLLFVDTDDKIKWKTSTTIYDLTATGFANPMTTTGDIIYASSGSTPARRGIGTSGQFLGVASGLPVWLDAPNNSGFTDNGSAVNLTTQSRPVGIGVAADVSKKINVLSSSGHGIYSYNAPNVAIQGEATSGTGVKGLVTTGTGVYGESSGTGGTAVYGIAAGSSGVGIWGKSTNVNGFGFIGQNNAGGSAGLLQVETSGTNNVQKVATIMRQTTGTAAIGIGSGIEFDTEISDGGGFITGNIEHYLTNVTSGSVTSEFQIKTLSSGTMRTKQITAQYNIVRFSSGLYTTTEQTGTVINQGNSTGISLDASPQHGQTHTLINQYTSQINCSTYYNFSNTSTTSIPASTSITVQYDSSDSKWYRIQ